MYKDLSKLEMKKLSTYILKCSYFQPKNRENKHSNHSLRLNLVHATTTLLGLSTFQPFEQIPTQIERELDVSQVQCRIARLSHQTLLILFSPKIRTII